MKSAIASVIDQFWHCYSIFVLVMLSLGQIGYSKFDKLHIVFGIESRPLYQCLWYSIQSKTLKLALINLRFMSTSVIYIYIYMCVCVCDHLSVSSLSKNKLFTWWCNILLCCGYDINYYAIRDTNSCILFSFGEDNDDDTCIQRQYKTS